MEKSESIKELATALAITQGQMVAAKKDTQNPFYKQNYADLASVWEAARKPLSGNGLSVVQCVQNNFSEISNEVEVETILLHNSGEWISSKISIIPAKQDAQGYGATISYLRRYALSAMIGGYADDDDGEKDRKTREAEPTPQKQSPTQAAAKSVISEAQAKRLFAIAAANKFTNEQVKKIVEKIAGVEHTKDILRGNQYNLICETLGDIKKTEIILKVEPEQKDSLDLDQIDKEISEEFDNKVF